MPERVNHSAAHLLLSITTTVRPAFLLQLPAVQTMYTAAAQGSCQGLTIEVCCILTAGCLTYFLQKTYVSTLTVEMYGLVLSVVIFSSYEITVFTFSVVLLIHLFSLFYNKLFSVLSFSFLDCT